MYTFGFIGCGNMGGALAVAVSKKEKNIALADKNGESCEKLAALTGGAVSSNEDIAKNARYIVLGVKPQILPAVLEELAPTIEERTSPVTIISMAAGVSLEKLGAYLPKTPVIRIMPNTPAAVGEGMIVYCTSPNVSEEDRLFFESAFSPAGDISLIPENLIDAASAISGCGPAFVYMFTEALIDGGIRSGLPAPLAKKLAAKTVSGAGKTVLLSDKHPGELRTAVCSPAGSTIEGVAVLEKEGMRSAVAEAVSAAYLRTKELGK